MEEEISNCKEDILYFAQKYLHFNFSEDQYKFIKALVDNNENYLPNIYSQYYPDDHNAENIVKAYILWKILFGPKIRIFFIISGLFDRSCKARNLFKSIKCINDIKNMYFSLPSRMQDQGSFFTKNKVTFSNGSIIEVLADFGEDSNYENTIAVFFGSRTISLNKSHVRDYTNDKVFRDVINYSSQVIIN